jgi:hypothetical protein
MLCRVALVRTDVSEKFSASFIRLTRIGELGITLAVTSNRRTLRRNKPQILQIDSSLQLGTTFAKISISDFTFHILYIFIQ